MAEEVGRRHAHIVEEQFRGVAGLLAHLVQVASALETVGVVGLDEQQRDALGARGRVGLAHHADQVGGLAVGDEGLLAADHIAVAVLLGGGAHALQVGAGARFGHGDGGDHFARDDLGQPALFLFLRAEGLDVGGDDAIVQGDAETLDALEAHLLDDHRLVAEVAAGAAIGLGHRNAQEARLGGLEPQLALDDPRLAPRLHLGGAGVLVEEAPHGVLEDVQLLLGHEGRLFHLQHAHGVVSVTL